MQSFDLWPLRKQQIDSPHLFPQFRRGHRAESTILPRKPAPRACENSPVLGISKDLAEQLRRARHISKDCANLSGAALIVSSLPEDLPGWIDAETGLLREYLKVLGVLCKRVGKPVWSGMLFAFLGDFEQALKYMPQQVAHLERAHVLRAAGREEKKTEKQILAAACAERASRFVTAAMFRIQAGDVVGAIKDLHRVQHRMPGYETALTNALEAKLCFDQAQSMQDGVRFARVAIGFLEEVASQCEEDGFLVRAFDCYRVMSELGKMCNSFENTAEGHLGQLRVARKYRFFGEAQRLTEEVLALATQAREQEFVIEHCLAAARFCREFLQEERARQYIRLAGEKCLETAPRRSPHQARYLVRLAVDLLSTLPGSEPLSTALDALVAHLHEPQVEFFQRIRGRIKSLPGPVPHKLEVSYTEPAFDIPFEDLLAWEADGVPYEVCLPLFLNPQLPELTRRHALVVLLCADQTEDLPASVIQARALQTTRSLGSMRIYEVTRPLSRIYFQNALPAQNHTQQRLAVVQSLPRLPFASTIALCQTALADPVPEVVRIAADALVKLGIPELFTPIAQVASSVHSVEGKCAAVAALGRIGNRDAVERLLWIAVTNREPRVVEHALAVLERLADLKYASLYTHALRLADQERYRRIESAVSTWVRNCTAAKTDSP